MATEILKCFYDIDVKFIQLHIDWILRKMLKEGQLLSPLIWKCKMREARFS